MLLGRPCASDGKALLPADVERAISVLRERFAFVGLLEGTLGRYLVSERPRGRAAIDSYVPYQGA